MSKIRILLITTGILLISLSLNSIAQNIVNQKVNNYSTSNLSKQDIIDYGCDYMSSNLIQRSTKDNWITLDSEKPNVKNYQLKLSKIKDQYQSYITEARNYLNTNPDIIINSEVTKYLSYMGRQFQDTTDELIVAINDIAYVEAKEGYAGKSQFNDYYIKYLQNQKLSASYIINYFNGAKEKLINSTILESYQKSDLTSLLTKLEENTNQQSSNLIQRTDYLINQLNNKFAQISSIDVEGNNCIFSYYDIELKIKTFKAPFQYQPICEKKINNPTSIITSKEGVCLEYK
jgi:hypothetical protein